MREHVPTQVALFANLFDATCKVRPTAFVACLTSAIAKSIARVMVIVLIIAGSASVTLAGPSSSEDDRPDSSIEDALPSVPQLMRMNDDALEDLQKRVRNSPRFQTAEGIKGWNVGDTIIAIRTEPDYVRRIWNQVSRMATWQERHDFLQWEFDRLKTAQSVTEGKIDDLKSTYEARRGNSLERVFFPMNSEEKEALDGRYEADRRTLRAQSYDLTVKAGFVLGLKEAIAERHL